MGAPKTWAISHAVMAKVAAEANSSDHAMMRTEPDEYLVQVPVYRALA